MLNFPPAKVWAITIACIVGCLLAVPSFLPGSVRDQMPAWLRPTISLGLDLAGGSHLLLEADTSQLTRQRLEALEDVLRRDYSQNNIEVADASTANNQLTLTLRNPAQLDDAVRRAESNVSTVGLTGQREWDVTGQGNQVVMRSTSAGDTFAVESAMAGARDVIERRINSSGTVEPTIIRQGASRILVQVPGIDNPEQVRQLIGRTARLEFKMVADVPPEQVQSGRVPPGTQLLPQEGGGSILVQRRALISGDQIADARQNFDQNQQVNVIIQFNSDGGQRFANATRQNVGKRFAIVLDGVVLSAPTINEPILGGSASVTGSFTVESANDLAISLRSGRLPVELRVIEQRAVGPDLGADSIRAGLIACIVATIGVLLLMFLCYGRFGMYANLAVIINLLVIVGVMAVMKATLTLPGIAGFVLTIGAAVDANVLINERIREERRKGRTVIMAVENGYKEASRTIFEANVIHTLSAIIMIALGSGAVRGFAIVLLIGVITSYFTAVFLTRMLVSLYLRRHKPSDLHI